MSQPVTLAEYEACLDRQTKKACASPKDPVARTALAGLALDAGYKVVGRVLQDPKAGRKLLADTWKRADELDVAPTFLLLRVLAELPELAPKPAKTPQPTPAPQVSGPDRWPRPDVSPLWKGGPRGVPLTPGRRVITLTTGDELPYVGDTPVTWDVPGNHGTYTACGAVDDDDGR